MVCMRYPFRLLRYVLAGWLPGGRRLCALCGHAVWRFMPYQGAGSVALMDALETIGSDIRHFECPRCGAHDRERHLYLFMQGSGMLHRLGGLRVLHFAPERRLWKRIAAASPARYVRCDLVPASADVEQADIACMPFADESFDLVIANHVLEHVENDTQAAREICRVLAVGGFAILQTPYSPMLERTWSDAGIVRSEARLQAYGQEDHVRLFGRDIFERLSEGGLTPHIGSHEDLLPDVDARRYGVNPREPFFLFRKEGPDQGRAAGFGTP